MSADQVQPVGPARPGYEATGDGYFAECPDHGTRMMWDAEGGYFTCRSADIRLPEHDPEDNRLAPRDVYVEHDESWRVVDGALWVELYAELVEIPANPCSQCGEPADDGGHGMCAACLHDARRSGWEPGKTD